MSLSVFGSSTFCVVTGASQGIGQAVALHLAPKFGSNSVMVLTARNGTNLDETKAQIVTKAPNVEVRCVVGDLGNQETIAKVAAECFDSVTPDTFQHAIIVQCAGSLGDLVYIRDLNNAVDIQKEMLLNVTSAFVLTPKFLNTFQKSDSLRRTVINISSLAAIQPVKSWGLYCTTKAGRDMVFKVVAEEEQDVRVLNWAPGPVRTIMITKCTEDSADADTRQMMRDARDSNMVLTCDQTCEMLMHVIEKDEFKSGDHVDYFDVKK
ncbi:sepiapterin reductase-like [Amphiura filiformis]|uniref:sepiapterin reductase-like n=1 Tax=Amphiura filiformis TaxID=82378 RepID=UPI003B214C5A